jgi:lysophospholipase L1-like esterase
MQSSLDHKLKRSWTTIAGIAVITLLLLEVTLRTAGFYKTYTEKMDGKYVSFYDKKMPSWYWMPRPSDSLIDVKPEYTYRSKTNSTGFRDQEFDTTNDRHIIKGLVLGDSFVQSLGAPADSTWPHLLEQVLNSNDSIKYRIYNCGASGSDPFFEYTVLRDKLLKLHPDLVVMSINYSDVNDYITRGGMERFRPDGTTVFSKGPWFEPIYKHCHLVRLLLHFVLRYDFSLLSPSAHDAKISEALTKLADCADTTAALCARQRVRFLVVIHPYIDPYDRYLKKQERLPELTVLLQKKNVAVINLFDDFSKTITEANYKTYSWARDMHYTSKGYELFAHFLAKEMKNKYPELLNPETYSKTKGDSR